MIRITVGRNYFYSFRAVNRRGLKFRQMIFNVSLFIIEVREKVLLNQLLLVKNHVRMGGLFSGNKESSKSYREGTARKLKSMALPYKTKVSKNSSQSSMFKV